jgi:hypothetical protein
MVVPIRPQLSQMTNSGCHSPIDLADRGGRVEGGADVSVHGARAIDLAHPVIGIGADAEPVEGLDEDAGEVPRVRGVTVARGIGNVCQRHAHRALDGVGGEQRLGVHRIEVVDAVAQLDLHARVAERAGDGVDHHRPAQAADVDGPRRGLRVVDDLAAGGRRCELVSPEHACLADAEQRVLDRA